MQSLSTAFQSSRESVIFNLHQLELDGHPIFTLTLYSPLHYHYSYTCCTISYPGSSTVNYPYSLQTPLKQTSSYSKNVSPTYLRSIPPPTTHSTTSSTLPQITLHSTHTHITNNTLHHSTTPPLQSTPYTSSTVESPLPSFSHNTLFHAAHHHCRLHPSYNPSPPYTHTRL